MESDIIIAMNKRQMRGVFSSKNRAMKRMTHNGYAARIEYFDYLPDQFRTSAVHLFLDALRDKLVPILEDDNRARTLLENSLDPTYCITAIHDGRLVGLLAIKDSTGSFLNPTLKTMLQTYGILSGLFRMFGLATLHHSTTVDEFHVDGVAVIEEMRGKGVGSQLFAALEQKALESGIQTISLEVIDTNPRAELLYERLGFTSIKHDKLWPLNQIFRFPFESGILMTKKLG